VAAYDEASFKADVLKQMANNIGLPGQLEMIAAMYGVKRRWFGLESDDSLRKRVREVILSRSREIKAMFQS
jgi:hypothetical protein